MNRSTRSVCLALGALAISAAPAVACVNVGVYQDKPASTLPALQKKAGKNVKTVSTYLTVGHALDPKLIKLARTNGVRLIISWLPDKGSDSVKAPGFRLSAIAAGKFDQDLKALALQIKALPHGAIVRPMPDPNTPWYAWSGTVNGNRPGDYVPAWKHVRKVLTKTAGKKVKLLWSVYARSVPDDKKNALKRVLPGRQAGRPRRRRRLQLRERAGPHLDRPGRPVPAGLRHHPEARGEEAVLDLRDGLDRHAAATRAPGSAHSDSWARPCPSWPEWSGTTSATAPATSAYRARAQPERRSRRSSRARASNGIRSHDSLVERE